MLVNIYTDGGSRGNPGISGYGVVIYNEQNQIIHQESKYLGIKTNNEAEYHGLIAALTWVRDHRLEKGITDIGVFSDSQLMVRQIQGKYKVKSSHLRPLYETAVSLLQKINIPYQFYDILRHKNELADSLANQAMDRRQ